MAAFSQVYQQQGNPYSQNLLLKKETYLEFYPEALLDLYFIVFLALRHKKIELAGHQRHNEFPFSIKLRMYLIIFWLLLTLGQVVALLISAFSDYKVWIE